MKLLLDTCAWLWWNGAEDRLGPAARALIADPETEVILSSVVSWEVAIKHARGRLVLPTSPGALLEVSLREDSMSPLAIEHAHALLSAELPPHHADPFDRLLIAQAQVERLPILTSDAQLRRYDVEVIDAQK